MPQVDELSKCKSSPKNLSKVQVYVGGDFRVVGDIPANYIAKWNGGSWSALDSGVNGHVQTIDISGGNVYVGGDFDMAGGLSASRVARWNGSSWTALGRGIDIGTDWGAWVSAITTSGNDVYVGGGFTQVIQSDGIPVTVNGIAKWDGSSWSTLSSGVSGGCPYVSAIAVNGSDVYVGGCFATAGGIGANNIAKWNGNSWSVLGSGSNNGVNSAIYAIAVNGNDVYVGGSFTLAGGVSANKIAKWNATSNDWSALGSGIEGGFPVPGPFVGDIVLSGGDVYIGGCFTMAGGANANNIAKWNGSSWSALGSGLSNVAPTIATSGSNVYVGGQFRMAGGKPSYFFGRWNSSITIYRNHLPVILR
jgi:hypothetical protein